MRCALWFSLYTLGRPGEVRQALWGEIDLEEAVWEIPAERMKKRRPHAVPLSRQAVALLTELRPLTGRWRYVFPSARNDGRPMSENAVRGIALLGRPQKYGNKIGILYPKFMNVHCRPS